MFKDLYLHLLGEDPLQLFGHGRLGGGRHEMDGGLVEPPGGGLPVEHQPGAHHQLKDAVPQVGKAQAADGPDLVRGGV